MDKLTELKSWLILKRGTWKSIAENAGVSYWTLQKFAQGVSESPNYKFIEKLDKYKKFDEKESKRLKKRLLKL